MKIAFGCDHGGFDLKEPIINYLNSLNEVEILDFGTNNGAESVDYPDFARKVAEAVMENKADLGILVCGTGIGISIAANKFHGVRAALCYDEYTARMSKAHNNANILALGGRTTGSATALEIVKVWLNTPFEGGRHERRIKLIEETERKA